MVDDIRAIEYGKRFKSAMDARFKDISPAQAAHQAAQYLGITYQGVKKLAAGGIKEPGAYTNAKAAELFGVGPDWLALGDPHPRERGKFAVLSAMPSRSAPPWPLDGVDEAKVRALEHDDKVRLITTMLISAHQLGLDVEVARPGRRANSARP